MDYKQTYYKRQDVEEFKKTVNQSAINNINEFMTNPISQMINIINENNLTISQYLAQNNVQSLAKALKLTNLDTLKVNFTSDINENASYNPLTNEITLNTRNEGNYIPIIAHEMVGHAILGEVIQSDNGNAIYEHIAKNILSEQELANIRNNYTELDESGFKEEVVSFGLQKIMNNTNNLSYKKFIRKFFPSSLKENIYNKLETIFRNNSDNRVLNEIRKTIRQVLDENIANTNNQELAVKYAKDISNNNAKIYYDDQEINVDLSKVHLGDNGKIVRDSNTEILFKIGEEELSKAKDVFDFVKKNFYDDIVKRYNLSLDIGLDNPSIKSLSSFADRLYRNLEDGKAPNGQLQKPKDYIRGTFIFDSSNYKNLSGVYKDLSNYLTRDIDIKGYENGQEKSGYKGIHLNLNYNDVNIEIQLHTEASWKQKLKSDKFYDKYRSVKDFSKLSKEERAEHDRLEEQDKKEWDYLLESDKDFQNLRAEAKSLKETASSLGSSVQPGNGLEISENLEPSHSVQSPSTRLINRPVDVTVNNSIENTSSDNDILTQDEKNTKKFAKSNILELSKNEVKDLANRKQGEVISYKSASDFIKSFNSIGEVLENRLGIKLNRNDTAVNDLFNDTNIQNSEVAVDNLFKNTLVDYNDTQVSLDTYLNNLGFKTNDLKSYLTEALKDKTKLSKESQFVNKLVNELNIANNKIQENRNHLKNYKRISSKVKNLVELIDKNKKPSAYGDINTDEISALRNFVS